MFGDGPWLFRGCTYEAVLNRISDLKFYLLASALCLVLSAANAFAWGKSGHMIVGEIAERNLTPKAKQAVDEILKGKRLGDDRVASWPDDIRHKKKWEATYPFNDKWHYIDISITTNRIASLSNTVVSAIAHFAAVLKSNEPDAKRLDALRYLDHFVGDVHQPLHCACRNGDRGGNELKIDSFTGTNVSQVSGSHYRDALNLHKVWDTLLVQESMGTNTTEVFANQLASEITPAQKTTWATGTPLDWAKETHMLARSSAYKWNGGQNMPTNGIIDLTRANYIDANSPVVRMQLKRAGIRLATILNQAFGE